MTTAPDHTGAIDSLWMLLCGILVFFMQAGFSMVESGSVRQKNTQSILMKNVIDTAIGSLGWMVCGYALASGDDNWDKEDGGGFVGTGFELEGEEGQHVFATHKMLKKTGAYASWFFGFTFCATCATIVSGALAERCQLGAYVVFSLIMSVIIYPIVVHWTWANGFLAKRGYADFAGSGVVHMLGGVCALVGAIILGPRLERFNPDKAADFAPSSISNICLGTFILWFGWYGFNAGSVVGGFSAESELAAMVCATTTISAAAGGVTNFFLASYRTGLYDTSAFANGILGGLVSITAGCNNVELGVAMVIGIIGGFVLEAAVRMMNYFKIDDPIQAFPVHGACGLWGVIAIGIFDMDKGHWYGGHFDHMLGPNIVGAICIIVWGVVFSAPFFWGMKKMGLLRVDVETELLGLDAHYQHGDSLVNSAKISEAGDAAGFAADQVLGGMKGGVREPVQSPKVQNAV